MQIKKKIKSAVYHDLMLGNAAVEFYNPNPAFDYDYVSMSINLVFYRASLNIKPTASRRARV
jgi:hypothetical protein